MSDAAIEAALARRQEVARLLPTLAAELKRLDAFIDTWHDMMGTPRPVMSRPATPRRINPPREVIAQACADILVAHGKPMKRKELLGALVESGIVLNGQRPLVVLNTTLWRSKDLVAKTPDGYVPAPSERVGA